MTTQRNGQTSQVGNTVVDIYRGIGEASVLTKTRPKIYDYTAALKKTTGRFNCRYTSWKADFFRGMDNSFWSQFFRYVIYTLLKWIERINS
mgnify:CR=1 FL=1